MRIGVVFFCGLMMTGLSGCNQYWERKDTVYFGAGDAVAANTAIQVADPWPARSRNTNIAFDGQRTATAVQRYRSGNVIQPKSQLSGSAMTSQAPSQ
jgi:type IV pilus biogenesis protein CpaD/CtpE